MEVLSEILIVKTSSFWCVHELNFRICHSVSPTELGEVLSLNQLVKPFPDTLSRKQVDYKNHSGNVFRS